MGVRCGRIGKRNSRVPENPSPEQEETVREAMDELKDKVGEVADVDEKEATSVVEKALDEAVASNLQTQADDVQSDVENKIENNNNDNDSVKTGTKELDSKMKAFTQSTKNIANTLGTQIGKVKEKAKGVLSNMKKELNEKIETKEAVTLTRKQKRKITKQEKKIEKKEAAITRHEKKIEKMAIMQPDFRRG